MNPPLSHHRKPAVVPQCSKKSAHWKISNRAILKFHFREMVQNESESVTGAFNSQLRGGLFIPPSHLSSRPSDGEDKSVLMSLWLCWVPVREACSGRNSKVPSVLSLSDLNQALMLCCRTEGPQQPLPVLLRECVATSLLCYMGTSGTIGQVRTAAAISHLTCVFMSNSCSLNS